MSLISVDGSLSDNSDNSEEDSSDKEEQTNREGHPIGSGLSAATRMRFEKKRAQLVERQSAEQRLPHEEPEYEVEREQKPRPSPRAPRAQFGELLGLMLHTFFKSLKKKFVRISFQP